MPIQTARVTTSTFPSGSLTGDAGLFRAAADAAAVPMMITGPGLGAAAPAIVFVNKAMTTLTGYAANELVGRSPRILVDPKRDRKEARRRRSSLLRDGTYTGQAVGTRKDGASFVASWTIAAIAAADGDVLGWVSILRDETARQRTQDASAGADVHHRARLEAIPHLVWQSHDNGRWSAASPQWSAFTGQSALASKGAGWREAIHPQDRMATDDAWRVAVDTGVLAVEHRVRRHDDVYRWFQTRALPIPAGDPGRAGRVWIGTSTDVHELHEAEERIRYLAFHDVLTDAGNRAMLQGALGQMTRVAGATVPFNVLYLDVDDFKLVNDDLGHRGGDEVLREISRQLICCSRDVDIVARIGGDEFVLVQANAGPIDGTHLAERIRTRFEPPPAASERGYKVSVSIGVASFPEDGSDADELLRRADLALFAAKTAGRGCVRRFERSMETARRDRLTLQTRLARAIEQDELEVAYQPVCDAKSRMVLAYEALARWTHPERGIVSPEVFVPIAEESGLIVALGEQVLARACADAADRASAGRRVAVNLSPAQFRSGSLTRTIMKALDRSGLPADRLELEVTESLLMDKGDAVDRTLREIKDAGVGIALDDFGTGHSNLGSLCRFPFDRLKIDRSCIRQMPEDPGARAVVSGIVALAHSLRLQVTAEGVETEEQLAILRDMGCDHVQGFLLGRPRPATSLD